jgi:3-oxoacid CoA-transferase subunit B
VTKVFTDIAVIVVTEDGFVLEETAPGYSPADIVAVTGAPLSIPDSVGEIAA